MSDIFPSADEAARIMRGRNACLSNLQDAWAAMRMIREAVETLGPIGAMPAEEHLAGPTFLHEAEAIVGGIMQMKPASPASPSGPEKSFVTNCVISTRGGETILTSTEHGIVATMDRYVIIPLEDYKRLASDATPAPTSGSEDGGGVLAGWCQPNGITKQAEYDIDQAIGGTYELPDGRSFWLDHVTAREIMRRAIPYIAAECERHRLAGGRAAKPAKQGGC